MSGNNNVILLRNVLRAVTTARVGQERAGDGVTTREWLDFKMAHAEARDAVHAAMQVSPLLQSLRELKLDAIALESQAADRATYLRRPDLGRRLSVESAEVLRGKKNSGDVVITICDGLSALAVERHAVPLLSQLIPKLREMKLGLAPMCVVRQGRVAVGDEIGALLNAKLCITLIGERPGLSAPDSLGAYLTWAPRIGCTDEARNCISNIRNEGLGYEEAAARIAWYANAAFKLGMTGVGLKDSSEKKLL
jgi:ethanolamine ammonia-lyase small subunit